MNVPLSRIEETPFNYYKLLGLRRYVKLQRLPLGHILLDNYAIDETPCILY